jgi:hypothetical protein
MIAVEPDIFFISFSVTVVVFSAGIATCAEAATLRHIPMIAPKDILPSFILSFLPGFRYDRADQGSKIYIFTRIPGGSQTKHGITWIYRAGIAGLAETRGMLFLYQEILHNRAIVAFGKSKPF